MKTCLCLRFTCVPFEQFNAIAKGIKGAKNLHPETLFVALSLCLFRGKPLLNLCPGAVYFDRASSAEGPMHKISRELFGEQFAKVVAGSARRLRNGGEGALCFMIWG